MNKTENIKNLWSQVKDKKEFIVAIADHYGMKPRSVENHWFSKYFSIPSRYIDEVINILQSVIRNQSLTKKD